ncbi:MAG: DegV family protein [Christensenellaceae bacterium]|jgi:DegV family protein with EDD domain|nr:DegV family protein [Christensenellaceae bacterium]
MKIAISAESTVDLSKDLLEKYNIHTVPFGIVLGDKLGLDGEISPEEIIAFVNKTGILPKTSAVNETQLDEHFTTLLETYDAVIHFSISSKLSSACSNARIAATRLNNVFVVDTLSLSTGIGLLAIYARKLIDGGLAADEVFKQCEARVKYIQASFVLDRLDYLYKGGRCSALALFGANILRIKPQIILKNGEMRPNRKYIGRNDLTIRRYSRETLSEFSGCDKSLAFITYTTATPAMISEARSALKSAGFKEIIETRAGATITSHCGDLTLGILFFSKKPD